MPYMMASNTHIYMGSIVVGERVAADHVVLSCDIKDFFMNIFLSEQRRHIVLYRQ